MKITSHAVSQVTQHSFSRKEWEQELTFAWVGDDPRSPQEPVPPPEHLVLEDKIRLSPDGRLRFQAVSGSQKNVDEQELAAVEDPKVRSIRKVLEILTGQKVRLTVFSANEPVAGPLSASEFSEPSQSVARAGWGVEYDYVKGEHEVETLEYSATGSVVLEDGRQLQFDLSMAMGREYASSVAVHIRAGDATLIDPLIVNFDGQGVALDEVQFSFDLDGDGELDSISLLQPGHGFLAMDWNEDGLINDGTELFGPESGNGFLELSKYDSDGNGWLDENDPLFEKLVVWAQDQAGTNEIISLQEAGVGALFVHGQEGLFRLNDSQNNQQGLVRETSFFLKEHGGAGTIQEVDFVV